FSKSRDKILGLENDVSGPIAIRRLQCTAHIPARGQRQPPVGHRWPCDVARQALELVTLRGLRGDTRWQRETRALRNLPARGFRLRRQRLQGEHLLALARTRRNPVRDRS